MQVLPLLKLKPPLDLPPKGEKLSTLEKGELNGD